MEKNSRIFNDQLPSCFLYRHAAELYLKSGIIIFHKRFSIPYREDCSCSEPQISIGKKWKSLYNVHDIKILFMHWKALLDRTLPTLNELSRTDWSFPVEVDKWVSIVQDSDPSSVFFRYPKSSNQKLDKTKSSMKPMSPVELQRRALSGGKTVKAFVVFDHADNIVKSFAYDDTTLETVSEALVKLVDFLHSAHFAMRVELCSGW